jgi:geranylgeranyl diphosphate synthase type I
MVVPPVVLEVAERVDGRLRCLLDAERARWAELDPALTAPFDALAGLVLGSGKRLRPAFLHWAFVSAGGEARDPRVTDAGAAYELLHAFALLHDDVMDGSPTRRGRPTAHRAFTGRHQASGWAGEPRRFGEGVAILVGDLAFVYADRLVAGAPPAALAVWDELRIELNVGQYLDLFGTATRSRELAAAERISRYKSGKYTIERPLHLGALLAGPGCPAALLASLGAYGRPLGQAFQLRDDVLGAFGDEALTGKPVGDDLREGKPTPLVALAAAAANSSQAAVLDRVGGADLDDDGVAAIQQVLVDTGALGEVEELIERLAGEALDALDAAEVPDDARKALAELAHHVAWRER